MSYIATKNRPAPIMDSRVLLEHGLLVKRAIGNISKIAKDDRVEQSVRAAFGLHHVEGKVTTNNIVLFEPKDILSFTRIQNEAQKTFKKYTTPWSWEGWGLLNASVVQDFKAVMYEHITELEESVEKFLRNDYSDILAKYRLNRGSLFRPSDYPAPDEFRKRVYIRLNYSPLPSPRNLDMLNIPEDLRRDMQKETETEIVKSVTTSVNTVYQRMFSLVSHLLDRLEKNHIDPDTQKVKNQIRDSAVNNIRELMEWVPIYNITQDPTIAQLREEILERICQVDAKTLREDTDTKEKIKQATKDIVGKLSSFMGSVDFMDDDE